MSDISGLFYRESYFTKKHNDNDNNNNDDEQEINLFSNKNNNKNNNTENIINKSSITNNNSNIYNIDTEESEAEFYSAEVETIVPIDEKINNTAIYNIKINSSLNAKDFWKKSCSLDNLIKFRDYLLKYTHSVINIPFPTKSLFRFIPCIEHKYDERNWDILLENKFLLDNFFSTICRDKEMYKLSGFISFFSKPPSLKRNSINILYN